MFSCIVAFVHYDEIIPHVSVCDCMFLCVDAYLSASASLLVCVQILKVYESTLLSSVGIF